jgi:hypothetical protein
MKRLTAEEVRKTMNVESEIYKELCEQIKMAALAGNSVLHVYKPVPSAVFKIFKEDGFEIYEHPNMSFQKDNLFYSIRWSNP